MNQPHTIFLDWYNTSTHNTFWGHWAQDNRKFELDKINQALFIDRPDLVDEWMRGACSCKFITEYLETKTGIRRDHLLKGLVQSSQEQQLLPEILPLIKQLQEKGIFVGIATDNMDVFTRWTLPALNLERYFDEIICSTDIGALKCDVSENGSLEFFRKYLSKQNLQPQDCILIDDSSIVERTVLAGKMGFRLTTEEKPAAKILQNLLAEIA